MARLNGSLSVKMEFEPEPGKRFFRRCRACAAEWPVRVEYCESCAARLDPVWKTENVLWYKPAGRFRTGAGRPLPEGINETTVLTVATCGGIYDSDSACLSLLENAVRLAVHAGGTLTTGPGGHLAACFAARNLVKGSTDAVRCAISLRSQSEEQGARMFLGINTGPVLSALPLKGASRDIQTGISGRTIAHSEAVAFAVDPGMVIVSPSTFRIIAPRFECYGTDSPGSWGTYRNVPPVVYIVKGPRRVTSWLGRLDDDLTGLAGRTEELASLSRYWENTRSGRMLSGLIVHLVGEPGAGKSRLLQAFLSHLRKVDSNMVLVKAGGANYGGRPGLLLEDLVTAFLREITPSVKGAYHSIPHTLTRQARLLSRLLAEMDKRVPVLVVIDDVHWADKESIRALGKVFSTFPARVMVVASYRPSGAGVAGLLRNKNTVMIGLGPLKEEEAKEISRSQCGRRQWISRNAWNEIWKKSGGNPLYVEEATRLLLVRGKGPSGNSLDGRGMDTSDTAGLPATREGLLSARIEEWAVRELTRLREELTFQWGPSVRRRLEDLENQVNDWLDRLETRGYLERTGIAGCLRILELFQITVIELCMSGGLIRPFGTRLNEAVSRLYAGCSKEHYRYLQQQAGTVTNSSPVGNQALAAAKRALEAGKPRETLRFTWIANRMLPPDHPSRTELLETTGDANLLLGQPGKAIQSFQSMLSGSNPVGSRKPDVIHKLLTARLLQGENVQPGPCQCGANPCSWHLILRALEALSADRHNDDPPCSRHATAGFPNRMPLNTASTAATSLRDGTGAVRKAAMLGRQAGEVMEGGGFSLLSLALHWVLSRAEEHPLRTRHANTWRSIARHLGATSAFRPLDVARHSLPPAHKIGTHGSGNERPER